MSSHRRPRRRRDIHPPQDQHPVVNLARFKPVALSALRPGAVVWASIPFSDTDGHKSRPCVVISRAGRDITVAPMSTGGAARNRVDCLPVKAAGVSSGTVVLPRPVTVDVIDVYSVAGHVDDDDFATIASRAEAFA